ncbi:MAG: hypothetical protein F6K14_06955 [Symploca sp. SIO2C1]|nr:hypothetical protein [Symploca sp. SIO2C1]
MNSDMDNNSDALYNRLIAWLNQESIPPASPQVDLPSEGRISAGETTAAEFEQDQLDPIDSEELNIASFNNSQADQEEPWTGLANLTREEMELLGGETRPYNWETMPTVQDRFEALLKRRIQFEIERRPPLFPWETEISDYESDSVRSSYSEGKVLRAFPETVAGDFVPPIRLWMPQLSNLTLPISIPENVLGQLLNACSEAMSSQRQLGAKLVNAVENLFPNQLPMLNQMAGMVLISSSPARGGSTSLEPLQSLPSSYEDAAAEQKMLLALLAAKEIISTLTVSVSSTQTPVERQWETAAGVVRVKAEYQMAEGVPLLHVISYLPKGGSLALQTPELSATAQRAYPGYLSVELFDLQPNQTYPLEIRFHDSQQTPLVFSIYPTR